MSPDPVPDPRPDPERPAASERPAAGEPGRAARVPVGPQPMTKPARGALSIRDMLVALGVMLAVVLVIGGLSRGFGFAPTGPTVDSSAVPVVDAAAELRALAPQSAFPLRVPVTPPGWRSNSTERDQVRGTTATSVRVGYLTPQSQYLQFLQSDATEEALLAAQAGARTFVAQGVQDVDGQRWVVYGAQPDEPIWIADLGQVRLLVSGSGTDEDYRALAAAAQTGTPAR